MIVLPPAIEGVISTNSNSSVTHSSSSWEPLTLIGELPVLRMCPALEEPPHDWAVAAARTPQSTGLRQVQQSPMGVFSDGRLCSISLTFMVVSAGCVKLYNLSWAFL